MPMQRHVGYTPVEGAHVTQSELCASCHTVITRPLDAAGQPIGPEVNEQTTPEQLAAIQSNLERVLGDVRLAVRDWKTRCRPASVTR